MTTFLEVKGLNLSVRSYGVELPILRDVSITVDRSETVAIVGETGSGKTLTAKAVMGVLPKNALIHSGSISFDGTDMLAMEGAASAREHISMIFQNPMSSINPLFRVEDQMNDVLSWSLHGKKVTREERADRIRSALEDAKCYGDGKILRMYPFQLSGGMRQRVMIAMALLRKPTLLIADEPTTALDVTTQKEILSLLLDLTKEEDMSLILITHNLGIALESSKRIYVMYAGRMVETGPTEEIFKRPLHPYTQGLINSIPSLDRSRSMEGIKGEIAQQDRSAVGCCFMLRCPYAIEKCGTKQPELKELVPGQMVACYVAEQGRAAS
jgi:peptide/nickel transport system ATP-binding protein